MTAQGPDDLERLPAAPDDAGPPVTVAVVPWNTRELLAECLRSLEPESESARASAWVIDNASTDGSAEMVRGCFPRVELVASSENLGFGEAVNEVARRSRGGWLAAANADVALRPGALAAMLAAGDSDPGAGAVAPRLLRPDGSTQHSVHAFHSLSRALLRHTGLHRVSRRLGDRLCLEGAWDARRPRRVDWADGAFLLVRREAFDAVGGFDAAQWMYAEDLDLAWRLRRGGWSVRYEPRAVVTHAVSAAAAQAFEWERFRRQTTAIYAWMIQRRGARFARTHALLVVVVEGLKLLALRPFAPLLGPGGERVLRRARFQLWVHRGGLGRRARILRQR